MFGFFLYSLAAFLAYIIYLLYAFLRNVLIARQTGLPTIYIPFMVQNHPIWMIAGPMSRLWLDHNLPTFLSDRLGLGIYGLEFYQRERPWVENVEPQVRANPKLIGHGKTYLLVTSGRLELWTWDAEVAREVPARPNAFQQFDVASVVMGIFGDNVLTTDGKEWSRHRRILASAVTERVSSVVWDESVRQTHALLASITKPKRPTDDTEPGTTYEMFDLMKRIAIHVLYAAGMKMSYIDAVKVVNDNTAGPKIIPTPICLNWPRFFPGSAWLRSIGQAKIEFPQRTRDALAREKQLEAETGQARNNVMSALISASERNEEESDAEKGSSKRKGPALTDQELVSNLYIFTAAGFDTTANTLAYALVLLARYPRWQAWMQDELDELLPTPTADNTDQPAPDYTAVFPRARRTLAIMLETLRLYPAIIHLAKQTKRPVQLTTPSCGTFTIPANTTVYTVNLMLHTDPAVWRDLNMTDVKRASASAPAHDNDDDNSNPNQNPDEHAFRPTRWLNPDNILYTPPKGSYLPWSAGPRVCPGQKMAQVEFVGVLATLFRGRNMEVVRREVQIGGVKDMESDGAVRRKFDALMAGSTPKLTLEMDVYGMGFGGEKAGLGLRWVGR